MVDAVEAFCAPADATILEALAVIDQSRGELCCLVDGEARLVAVFTDGDARRALLGGAALTDGARAHGSSKPRVVPPGTDRAHVLDLMKSLRLSSIPEVSDDRRIVAIHTLSDIVGAPRLLNRAVIMAGGRGTRLGALTKDTPKPLMTVAGRPIIEWIILRLVGAGITRISVSVNHMADQIIERLGDGHALGCTISYLQEDVSNPLGTAGSLTLLPEVETAVDAPPIIVLNGDLMVEFDAHALLQRHESSGAAMTMGTKTYQHSVPFGVVEVDEERRVTEIVEKPDLTVEVNAAVYCIDSGLVRQLPHRQPSTMPELAQKCLDNGSTVGAWPIASEWIDVGTPGDLARAKGEV
ncbi:sugar phosphate nucleotidyltransferase [Microbacterium sp. A93]|uniref:sugar phosphate nucleotidyltransferase n=1 Tax=Microbacterium sp. A93 TaxID=3450716 RepID=UPI003F440616